MNTSDLDKVHIIDARRAGRHARVARQTAIDVGRDLCFGVSAFFEHVFDRIDAAARTVALVAKHHVGRAGGRAEPTMHAAPQNALGFGDCWVFKLLFGEIGLHGCLSPGLSSNVGIHPARIENAYRIESALQPTRQALDLGFHGFKDFDRGSNLRRGPD